MNGQDMNMNGQYI